MVSQRRGENGSRNALWWALVVAAGAGVALAMAALVRNSQKGTTLRLITNLSPTVLLMSVFPFISETLTTNTIGNTSAMAVVLMVAVTIPWITSAGSAPTYSALQDVTRDDKQNFYYRFAQIWPALLASSLLPVIVFTAVGPGPR